MRALVLEDWHKIVVADRPDPVLGPHDVLLEVIATGICGSDVHGYTGETGRRERGQVMGHETVGRITRLGAAVSGLTVGDVAAVNPVIGCGSCPRCAEGMPQTCATKLLIGVTPSVTSAFAELLSVPAANVVPLPSATPVEHGALVEPLAVGYHAARRGGVSAGDAALVLGGGPIGQACVLAAQRLGARAVAVSEPSDYRRHVNERLGASAVDPTSAAALPTAVASALGGPPDVVIDAVGSSQTVGDALACAPLGAPIVLVGMSTPTLSLPAYEISTSERSVVGSFCYSPAEFQETAEWVGSAPAALAHLIDGRVGFGEAPAAFESLAAGDSAASKILVFP